MGSLRQLISHVFSSLLLVVVAGKFHRSLAICFNVMCYHALDFGNNDDLIMSAGALVYSSVQSEAIKSTETRMYYM